MTAKSPQEPKAPLEEPKALVRWNDECDVDGTMGVMSMVQSERPSAVFVTRYSSERPKISQTDISVDMVQLSFPDNGVTGSPRPSVTGSHSEKPMGAVRSLTESKLVTAVPKKRRIGTRAAKEQAEKAQDEDKSAKVKKLFGRLALDEKTMDAKRVHDILRIVHGKCCPLDETQVETTLDEFYAQAYDLFADSVLVGINSSAPAIVKSPSKNMPVDIHHGIDLGLFTILMDWDLLHSVLDEDLSNKCYTIREAFIKHGADLLIAFYTHLPAVQCAVERPFGM
jgi:hypothetical protein